MFIHIERGNRRFFEALPKREQKVLGDLEQYENKAPATRQIQKKQDSSRESGR